MKKRIIIAVIAVCVILVLVAGIFVWRHVEEQSRQQLEAILEEYDRITGLRMVAHLIAPDSNQPNRYAVWHNAKFSPRGDNLLQGITYIVENSPIVFVHSEEEARAFSDDIIVGWPSSRTQARLDTINGVIATYGAREDNTAQQIMAIEAFNENFGGLLTIEHMIENPCMVWELYLSFDSRTQLGMSRELGRPRSNTQEESS
jgi:hypothetical protein